MGKKKSRNIISEIDQKRVTMRSNEMKKDFIWTTVGETY